MTEAVYRTDGFLLHAGMSLEGQLDGKCHLLNYASKALWKLEFKKGVMVEK